MSGFDFDSFLHILGVFSGLKRHTEKWHEIETPPVSFYWTNALSWKFSIRSNISIYKPLNSKKKNYFFLLVAPMDLIIMNRKNQNKLNVCQSVVLQVYFQKKNLWIAEFYLFCYYSSNNFGPSKYCIFLHF